MTHFHFFTILLFELWQFGFSESFEYTYATTTAHMGWEFLPVFPLISVKSHVCRVHRIIICVANLICQQLNSRNIAQIAEYGRLRTTVGALARKTFLEKLMFTFNDTILSKFKPKTISKILPNSRLDLPVISFFLHLSCARKKSVKSYLPMLETMLHHQKLLDDCINVGLQHLT